MKKDTTKILNHLSLFEEIGLSEINTSMNGTHRRES